MSKEIDKNSCSFDNALRDNGELILSDFSRFDQLNFNCTNPLNMSQFTIYPNKQIILDKSFDLKKLNIIQKRNQFIFTIRLFNFKGFDIAADPFRQIFIDLKSNQFIEIAVHKSNFDFFISNISLNDHCDLKLFSSSSELTSFLFKEKFSIFATSIKYTKNICPLIFRNSFLNKLVLKEISSSFINKNEFEFAKLNFKDLNSTIYNLCLFTYHIVLKDALFNKEVYKELFFLELNGPIDSIQDDLFKSFTNGFKLLCIRMQYIENIFMKNNKWIQYLNYNEIITSRISIDFKEVFVLLLYQTMPSLVLYMYPDEDFCYFKDFPHQNLVLPVLKPTQTKCTCTLLYLIKNSHLAKSIFDKYFFNYRKDYDLLPFYIEFIIQQEDTFKDCLDNIQEHMKLCNFEQRLEKCAIKSIELENKSDFHFTIEDWQVVSSKSHLYLFILNQSVSILCLILNLITIFVIRDKNISKEMKKTYTYLRIYTIINCLYLITTGFIKIVCHSDLFECYYSRNYITIRYFKLICIKVIGNILKTTSNITFISFTLSRYIEMTSNTFRIFKIINQSSIKKYLFAVLILSILLNIHIYFISSTNIQSSLDLQGDVADLKLINNPYTIDSYEEYKINFESTNQIILKSMQIIHIIFSDLFYIIVVVVIDLFLLSFVIKKMKTKKATLMSHVPDMPVTKRILNLQRQIKNSENRISNLVVLNGINFLAFKLPTALISFYSLIYYYDQTDRQYKPKLINYIICRYFRFCESLAELAHLFYLVSILIQFFIFYKLDKNFNSHCKSFESLVIHKVKYALNISTADTDSLNRQTVKLQNTSSNLNKVINATSDSNQNEIKNSTSNSNQAKIESNNNNLDEIVNL